jgi:branched-chain amino acid transport system ATP-binding protein
MRFGGVVALDGVSFDVEAGHISGLIGPNGAGKTTAFDVITRLATPETGQLELDGRSLLDTPAHRVVERGIARTFQNTNLFPTMSVLENVLVGAHGRGRGMDEKEARTTLDYVGVGRYATAIAATLPHATQKRVGIARALAARPRLLLLDEPAGGLDHGEVDELGEFIMRVRDDHELTVLLVEHHMGLVMGISDRVNVLNFGRTIAGGTAAEVRANPEVIDAYLGREERS